MTAETFEEEAAPEVSFLEALRELNTDRLFVHVDLDRLKIDPRYQRVVDKTRVRKMAANYNERLVGVLVCSVREDGVYVIDGQHRLAMLHLLDEPTARCELRLGLTIEDEAAMFYNLDTARVALSSDDMFRALLTAQDPRALAIKQAIEDAGFIVSFSGPQPGAVRAFKTLLKLTEMHGIEALRTALQTLHGAWPTSKNAAPAAILDGLLGFLQKYPEVSTRELSRTLANTTPDRLITNARAISGSMSWNTKTSMGRAILAAYNYKRSTNQLEDRFGKHDAGAA